MQEEEKKAEEKKMEEKKPEESANKAAEEKKEEPKAEENKADESKEIVLRVFMHCEGCAKKVRRCLKGFQGVEDVQTDCKTHKVVVKGEKADPVKVLERIQRKSHRQVELLSPIPPPEAAGAEDPKKIEEKEVVKTEEKKEEPQVITVVIQIHMHCEACAQEIKRRILKMDGVENAEPDLKSSQVTVKGVFDPQKLVEYMYKRTGKHVLIVKQEPEKKEEEKGKEEKKEEEKDTKKGEAAATDGAGAAAAVEGGEGSALDLKRSEFFPNYTQNYQIDPYLSRFELNAPQMFSDENPNACSVM